MEVGGSGVIFADVFFFKKSVIFGKTSSFTQSNSVRAVLDIFCKIKGYFHWKCEFYILCAWNQASGVLWSGHKTSQFAGMLSSLNFFNVSLFVLSRLVIRRSVMSISSLVPELWQFSFIRDWPEIRESQIPSPAFWPISRDWGKLGIPNLTQMSLMKCY